jgi:hypothetical protein
VGSNPTSGVFPEQFISLRDAIFLVAKGYYALSIPPVSQMFPMVQLFKSPAEKADDEFLKAYEKGVNLGRTSRPTAVLHFQEASARYPEFHT